MKIPLVIPAVVIEHLEDEIRKTERASYYAQLESEKEDFDVCRGQLIALKRVLTWCKNKADPE